jgi:hypothetical protein
VEHSAGFLGDGELLRVRGTRVVDEGDRLEDGAVFRRPAPIEPDHLRPQKLGELVVNLLSHLLRGTQVHDPDRVAELIKTFDHRRLLLTVCDEATLAESHFVLRPSSNGPQAPAI